MTNFGAAPSPKLSSFRRRPALVVRGLPLTQGQILPISAPGLLHATFFSPLPIYHRSTLNHHDKKVYDTQFRENKKNVLDVWT